MPSGFSCGFGWKMNTLGSVTQMRQQEGTDSHVCPEVLVYGMLQDDLFSCPHQEIAPGQLSLEELLDMTDDQVCATVEKFGANSEECARLNASLSCLRSVHKSGESGCLVPTGRVPSGGTVLLR